MQGLNDFQHGVSGIFAGWWGERLESVGISVAT